MKYEMYEKPNLEELKLLLEGSCFLYTTGDKDYEGTKKDDSEWNDNGGDSGSSSIWD